jgi:pSer/pThr/pTyr-binding forkhead associated (FHA) protein
MNTEVKGLRAITSTALLLAVLFSILAPASAAAQTTYDIYVTSVSSAAFPEVSATVSISGLSGLRTAGLDKTAFTLLENNVPVSLQEVNEEEVGLQLAIVLESSDIFSRRNEELVTRLDFVKNAIFGFAVGSDTAAPYMKDALDSISIIAPEGIIIQNSTVGGEINNALVAYQSEFRTDTGLFTMIGQAIDIVAGQPLRPGMKREVVIFTSGIPGAAEAETVDIAERAADAHVTLHTVLVGAAAAPTLPLAKNVETLAMLTGGSYRYFEEVPGSVNGLWDILISQRVQYRLVYRSTLKESGQYSLQALANVNGTPILSQAESFAVAIQSPTIDITGLPTEIVRSTDEPGADPASIEPRLQTVGVQVEFPDDFSRSISRVQLIVDNAVVDEITDGPFDSLHWDLTGYTATSTHTVQAYVVDELGLEARTGLSEVLVTVTVPPSVTEQYTPYAVTAATAAIVILALSSLIFAVVAIVRRPTVVTNIVREAGARVKEATEPFIPTPHRGAAKNKQGKAYLERTDDLSPGPHPMIELIGDNLRLGRDETLAQIAINDKSVSRLHARITEEADGLFFVHDEGSTSGTWVNYKQVSLTGQQLRHDDVINLGRVQLRFRLRYNETQSPFEGAQPQASPVPASNGSFRETAPEHSTEPFEAAVTPPIKPSRTDTDPGISPSRPKPVLDPDQYHTEAFHQPNDSSKKPRK